MVIVSKASLKYHTQFPFLFFSNRTKQLNRSNMLECQKLTETVNIFKKTRWEEKERKKHITHTLFSAKVLC